MTHPRRLAFTVAAAAAGLYLGCGPTPQHTSSSPGTPAALTSDPGFATDPAVSREWLVYASDRGGTGSLHLWVRPLSGGGARRLTSGESDEAEPSFSPDGNTLAYRAEGEAAGIYLIPAKGGATRLLIKDGRRPRFSPDGRQIAYWSDGGNAKSGVFVAAVSDGQSRPVQAGFRTAAFPTWSTDGQRLIFSGCKDDSEDTCDWWVTALDGSEATATGAAKVLRDGHIAGASPELWTRANEIVFAGRTGEKTRLWSLAIGPGTWQVAGKPQRLTSGDRDERAPAIGADGGVVFASRTDNVDVWTLPLDANGGKSAGALVRVTNDPSIDQRPSLSADGKRVAWETSRGGNFEVWVKDLVSGEERGLTNGPLREHMPALSRDGSKLVYDSHDGETVTVLESGFGGGQPVQVWQEKVGQGSFQWTAKGDAVLYFHREPPGTVGLMNLKSKKRTVLLRHPKFNLSLADARLSPDGRAIAFPVPFAPHRTRLAVARLQGKVIEDERDWTYLTPETHNASQPEWSPDGRRLYFLSDESGRLAVWTLAVSPGMQPQGDPQTVLDLAGRRMSIAEMRPRDIGLSVATDKLALGAAEYSGTLWSIRR